jgi:hypothetical protein
MRVGLKIQAGIGLEYIPSYGNASSDVKRYFEFSAAIDVYS